MLHLISLVAAIIIAAIGFQTVTPSLVASIQGKKGQNVAVTTNSIYNAITNYIAKNNAAPSTMTDLINGGYISSAANSNGDGGTFTFTVDMTKGIVDIYTTFSTTEIMNAHLNNTASAYGNAPVIVTGKTVDTKYVLPSSVGQFFLQAYTGPTAPSSSQYSRWYDTSGSTVVLKLYDSASGTWKATSTTTASSVGTIYSSPTALYSTVGTSGEIRYAYDTTSNALQSYTYYNGAWYLSSTTTGGGVKTITLSGGTRTWSDGSYATSCKNYITPPSSSYTYAGDTGSGIYRIDPDGSGSIPAFNAYCDMTTDGGGYTFPKHNITTLYTGNGSTQSVNTGVDMATQWGSSSSEKYGGLVWIKNRSIAASNHLEDSIRGATKYINTEASSAQASLSSAVTSFNNNGFSASTDIGINGNSYGLASWNFQTTHTISGTTNQGQPYVIHYNPWSGFMIAYYTGSGTAGHQIPNPLGRKLGFATLKNLSTSTNWVSGYRDGYYLYLNATSVEASGGITTFGSNYTTLPAGIELNSASNNYVLYGFANAFYDSTGGLVGDYEIGTYSGTGATGNKVTTKGQPAWVMLKGATVTSSWIVIDAKRGDYYLQTNSTAADGASDVIDFQTDGFVLKSGTHNNSGGTFLYVVGYESHK